MEADEYAGNFDPYRPDVIVLTSAEWDHPDVFADREAVLAAFEAWIRRAAEGRGAAEGKPVLVANVGDAGVAELVARLGDWPGRMVRTAVDPEPGAADLALYITAADPDGTSLQVAHDGLVLSARIPTAGRHNASNAAGVVGACLAAGHGLAPILAALSTFPGVGRRLECKGEAAGVIVYDDYGHHPTAIRETLAAVRQRAPGRRVWAVYEPLTFHRTAALLDAFADVLASADAVAIADIWAGRDPDTTITSAGALADAVARRNPAIAAAAPGSVEATAAWLAGEVRAGDAVLVMGGGKSYRIGELLLEHLRRPLP
ncbi:MAG: cyanophycin synthetase [Chloroflexota bacterium]